MNTEPNDYEISQPIKKIELVPCKICGKLPSGSYPVTTSHLGCNVIIYEISCTYDEVDIYPFLEHSITVYGKDKEEASLRWNDINKEN